MKPGQAVVYNTLAVFFFQVILVLMDELLSCFKGQALHAYSLSFEHPVKNELMEFKCDPPQHYLKAVKILKEVALRFNRDDMEAS